MSDSLWETSRSRRTNHACLSVLSCLVRERTNAVVTGLIHIHASDQEAPSFSMWIIVVIFQMVKVSEGKTHANQWELFGCPNEWELLSVLIFKEESKEP